MSIDQVTTAPGELHGGRLLRDLPDDEFLAHYQGDRFTMSILAARFNYVMEHVCSHLLRGAFSPIIREYYDFSAGLAGPPGLDYATAAVAKTLPVFFGIMRDAIAATVDEYGVGRIQEGDLLVCNDSYRVGTHINDTCFVRPIFYRGELVSFVAIRGHMLDMGGVVPGGFSAALNSKYEVGLTLPPMLLFREDKPVKSTLSLILDNVRFGEIILPDLLSIHSALAEGEKLVHETLDKYGMDAYLGAVRYACDASAETIRTAFEALPDGEYYGEDVMDCDAADPDTAYRIAVTIKKRGGRAEIDLNGTSASAKTSINCAWPDIKSVTAMALKYVFKSNVPFTSGILRHVDIVAPLGTVVTAQQPTPVMMYFEASFALGRAIMNAFANVLGPEAIAGGTDAPTHYAHGVLADGTPWVEMATCGGMMGPFGATSAGDADSGETNYFTNYMLPPIESIELNSPVMIMRHEYLVDTAGPGTHRGGAATLKDSQWLTAATATMVSSHARYSTGTGVYGGRDGRAGGVWFWSSVKEFGARHPFLVPVDAAAYASSTPVAAVVDPETHVLDPKGSFYSWGQESLYDTDPGAVWRYLVHGGGGWGDPYERDPQAVLRDVRDGYVSVAGAAEDYGVVVVGDPDEDPEGLVIDEAATGSLRAAGARVG